MKTNECEFAEQIIRGSNLYRCTYERFCDSEIYFLGKKFCRNALGKNPNSPESDLELGIGAADKFRKKIR